MAQANIVMKLVDKASADINKVAGSVNKLRDSVNQTATAGQKFRQFGDFMSIGVTGPVLAATTAIAGMVTATTLAADRIDKMAQRTGIGAEALQRLEYAASQSGVEMQVIEASSASFGMRLSELEGGSSVAAKAFQALGLSTKDANGEIKSSGQVYQEALARLAAIPDEATRSQLAVELFGEAGAKLRPLLNQGIEGIDELMARADELGIVMSEDTVKAFANFNDKMNDVKLAFKGVMMEVSAQFLPVIEGQLIPFITGTAIPAIRRFSATLVSLIQWFGDLSPATRNTVIAITAVATAIGPAISIGTRLFGVLASLGNVLRLVVTPAMVLVRTVGLGPLLPIFALVAGAIFLFRQAWQVNFMDIQGIVGRAVEFIGRVMRNLPAYWQATIDSLRRLQEFFSRTFGNLITIVRSNLDIMVARIGLGMENFKNVFFSALGTIADTLSSWADGIANILNPILDFLKVDRIETGNFLGGFREGMTANAIAAAEAVEAAEARIGASTEEAATALRAIGTDWEIATAGIRSDFTTIEDAVTDTTTATNNVAEAAENAITPMADYADGFDGIVIPAEDAAEAIETVKTAVSDLDIAITGTENWARKLDLRTAFGLDDALIHANDLDEALGRLTAEAQEILKIPNLFETSVVTDADGNESIEFVRQDDIDKLDTVLERLEIVRTLRDDLIGEPIEGFVVDEVFTPPQSSVDLMNFLLGMDEQTARDEYAKGVRELVEEGERERRAALLEFQNRGPIAPTLTDEMKVEPLFETPTAPLIEYEELDAQAKRLIEVASDVAYGMSVAFTEARIAEALGEEFDLAAARADVLEQAIGDLITAGVPLSNPVLAGYIAEFEALGDVAQTIKDDLAESLEEIATKEAVFGDAFDDGAAQVSAYRGAIEDLLEAGAATDDPAILEWLEKIKAIEFPPPHVLRAEYWEEESPKIRAELDEIADMSFALGDSFDATGAQISVYESAIKGLIENGFTPTSREVQNLVAGLETLRNNKSIEEFNEQFAALETQADNAQYLERLFLGIDGRFEPIIVGLSSLNGEFVDLFEKTEAGVFTFYNASDALVVAQTQVDLFRDKTRMMVEEFGPGSQEVIDWVNSTAEEFRNLNSEVRRLETVQRAFDIVLENTQNVRAETDGLTASQVALRLEIVQLRDAMAQTTNISEWLLLNDAVKVLEAQFDELAEEVRKSEIQASLAEWNTNIREALGFVTDLMKEFGASDEAVEAMNTLGTAVDDAFGAATSFASGDIIGGIVKTAKAIFGVFKWLSNLFKSEEQKRIEAIANIIKEASVSIASSITSSMSSAISDWVRATKDNSLEDLKESLKRGVYESVLNGLIDAIVQAALMEEIIQPLIEEAVTAFQSGNYDDFEAAVDKIGEEVDGFWHDNQKALEYLQGKTQEWLKIIPEPPEPEDYEPLYDRITQSVSGFGTFVSQAVSIPLYDAARTFTHGVDKFGMYVTRLVDEGIQVHSTAEVTVYNQGVPAY